MNEEDVGTEGSMQKGLQKQCQGNRLDYKATIFMPPLPLLLLCPSHLMSTVMCCDATWQATMHVVDQRGVQKAPGATIIIRSEPNAA